MIVRFCCFSKFCRGYPWSVHVWTIYDNKKITQNSQNLSIIRMIMLKASQNTSFTHNNLNPLEQKQPKINLKAHFFKNWLARKLGRWSHLLWAHVNFIYMVIQSRWCTIHHWNHWMSWGHTSSERLKKLRMF
jgi:hypothetical protein